MGISYTLNVCIYSVIQNSLWTDKKGGGVINLTKQAILLLFGLQSLIITWL